MTFKCQTYRHMVRSYRHTQTSQMSLYFEVLHASPTCSSSIAQQRSLCSSHNNSSKGFRSSSNTFSLPKIPPCIPSNLKSAALMLASLIQPVSPPHFVPRLALISSSILFSSSSFFFYLHLFSLIHHFACSLSLSLLI